MRNITLKQIEKLRYGTAIKLAPYPGRYPTRLLVLQKPWVPLSTQPTVKDMTEGDYKVLYLGKPNRVVANYFHKRSDLRSMIAFEFDKARIVASAFYTGLAIRFVAGPNYTFYHAYMQHEGRNLLDWLTHPAQPIRIGKFTAYNHYPAQTTMLQEVLRVMVKEPSGVSL